MEGASRTVEGKIPDLVIIDGDPLNEVRLARTGIVVVLHEGRFVRDDLGLLPDVRLDGTLTTARLGEPREMVTLASQPEPATTKALVLPEAP
jgi:hypothetical protein